MAIYQQLPPVKQEARLKPKDHTSAAHYSGGSVNEFSAVGQLHLFEMFGCTKYRDLETGVRGSFKVTGNDLKCVSWVTRCHLNGCHSVFYC